MCKDKYCKEVFSEFDKLHDYYIGEINKLKVENEELKKYVEPCYNPKTGEIEGYLCNVTMGFIKANEYKKMP